MKNSATRLNEFCRSSPLGLAGNHFRGQLSRQLLQESCAGHSRGGGVAHRNWHGGLKALIKDDEPAGGIFCQHFDSRGGHFDRRHSLKPQELPRRFFFQDIKAFLHVRTPTFTPAESTDRTPLRGRSAGAI
jgi:hypothetical protein